MQDEENEVVESKKRFNYILYHCMVLSKYTSSNFVHFPIELLFQIMALFIDEILLSDKIGILKIILYGRGSAHITYGHDRSPCDAKTYTGTLIGVRKHGQG